MVEYAKPSFPFDAFAGTASYYARYRPPYPRLLLRHLLDRARATGSGRLLDLACGPGRVALAIAPSFSDTTAIDLEPEMIDEGRRQAARLGLSNVGWQVGRAEDFETPSHLFELVTIGDAFHRLDQERVLRKITQWLVPGGGAAILESRDTLNGNGPWQRIVADVVQKWTRSDRSFVPASRTSGSGAEHSESALAESGFKDVARFTFTERYVWSVESILGNLHSTSFCSRAVLGDNAGAFADELTAELLSHDPAGVFREDLEFGYTFGRTPDHD
jgi:ubiquinone/menaquinone biosynthesis C-methylase UbiE